MRWNSIKWLAVVSILALFLSACSSDVEKEKSDVLKAAEQAFMATPEETNSESGELAFYLPSSYQIQEEADYNITIENKGDLILLFSNPNEGATSTLVSEQIEQNKDDYIEYVKFEKEDKVGFVAIKEISEDQYELTVGVGGVKITTQTATKRLADYAEQFMKMANSVQQ